MESSDRDSNGKENGGRECLSHVPAIRSGSALSAPLLCRPLFRWKVLLVAFLVHENTLIGIHIPLQQRSIAEIAVFPASSSPSLHLPSSAHSLALAILSPATAAGRRDAYTILFLTRNLLAAGSSANMECRADDKRRTHTCSLRPASTSHACHCSRHLSRS